METVFDHPLPAPDAAYAYNYPGSEGFQHQIAEVQACLAGKLLESPNYPLSEMVRSNSPRPRRPPFPRRAAPPSRPSSPPFPSACFPRPCTGLPAVVVVAGAPRLPCFTLHPPPWHGCRFPRR